MDNGPIEKIRAYLDRAKQEKMLYPLEKKGIFKIISGCDIGADTKELGLYEGRFIDIVAYATQLNAFYCACDSVGLSNPNHGHIEEVKVKKMKSRNKNLTVILNQYDNASKEKERLNKLLKTKP